MGNHSTLLRLSRKDCKTVRSAKEEKTLRIVKVDGKVLRYRAPILVKDLLSKFDGCGVGCSSKATRHLPQDYELMTGHVYHLLPLRGIAGRSTHQVLGRKKIKLLITKQQLHDLLKSKTVTLENILNITHASGSKVLGSSNGWSPQLETILEETESKVAV